MAEAESEMPGFFVYVVESPSAPDLYHGRSEGSVVTDALALDGIPCVTRIAINAVALLAALKVGLPEAMKIHPERIPILHVSAHGNTTGIQLSSGEVVDWSSLRDLLVPINESLSGSLILCMSACESSYAAVMAMEADDVPHPFLAMVGHGGKPTWSDTAISYLAFYHLLSKIGHFTRRLLQCGRFLPIKDGLLRGRMRSRVDI
jgi:hypothetical protein